MSRRARSNDGARSSVTRVLPIDSGLLSKLLAAFHEPTARRAPRVFHGPKAPNGAPPSAITDEQVLAMRKMREWYGMSGRLISEATGLPESVVHGIIEWRNRVHLDPGPRPAPAQPAAA